MSDTPRTDALCQEISSRAARGDALSILLEESTRRFSDLERENASLRAELERQRAVVEATRREIAAKEFPEWLAAREDQYAALRALDGGER